MSVSWWIIAGSVFILLLFITIGVGWWYRNRNVFIPPTSTVYNTPIVWSSPISGPDMEKNTCQLYQFPTNNINGIYFPGTPTFDSNILDNMIGTIDLPICIDSDQLIAQQVQHICIAPNGVVDGSITRCNLIKGGTTGVNGSESFYSNQSCSKINNCAGQLSMLSVNNHGTNALFPIPFCIQTNETNTVDMRQCDPTIEEQIFRITRVHIGQSPASLIPGKNQNGILTQLLHRDSGLCLVPGDNIVASTYYPSYLNQTKCSGPVQVFNEQNLKLGSCTGGRYPGYVWAFIPSMMYCPLVGGCTGDELISVPPQISYIGDLDINEIIVGTGGYQGLTGTNALIKWLIDNDVKSLYFGGSATDTNYHNNNLILKDFGLNLDVCSNQGYIPQYLNISTFNTMIYQQVCTINNNINCTNF